MPVSSVSQGVWSVSDVGGSSLVSSSERPRRMIVPEKDLGCWTGGAVRALGGNGWGFRAELFPGIDDGAVLRDLNRSDGGWPTADSSVPEAPIWGLVNGNAASIVVLP